MITVNGQKIEFKAGMTVADALKESNESIDSMALVMIDGKILSSDQLKSEKLINGANIRMLKVVSGG